MASKRAGCPLGKVQKALQPFNLDKVPNEAWAAVKEAEATLADVATPLDTEHIAEPPLRALSRAIKGLPADLGANLWEWLAVSEAEGEALPRNKALLLILGQIISHGGPCSRTHAAAEAYLALLAVKGADQIWSTVFMPMVFRKLLHLLKGLVGKEKEKKPKVVEGQEPKAAEEPVEDEAMEVEKPDVPEGLSVKELQFTLSCVVEMLQVRSLGGASDSILLTIDQLAALALRPLDETVRRDSYAGLGSLISHGMYSGDGRWIAGAVLKALLPGIIMITDRGAPTTPTAPKWMNQARVATLKFVRSIVTQHPRLLKPVSIIEDPDEVAAEAAEAKAEKEKKNAQRKAARAKKSEDDEDDYDPDKDQDEEAQEKEAQAASGATLPVKRRRPDQRRGFDDPVISFLQRIMISTPDRAEWRSNATESILSVLVEAANTERAGSRAVEGNPQDESDAPMLPFRRLRGKTTVRAADEDVPMEDASDAEETEEPSAVAEAAPAGFPGVVTRFLSFLKLLLQCERSTCRVLATEVAVLTVERSAKLTGVTTEADAELVGELFVSLVERCTDAVPTVRACAFNGVSAALRFLGRCGAEGIERLQGLLVDKDGNQKVNIAGLFRTAATDEKPLVRRSALAFFDTLVPLLTGPLGYPGPKIAEFFDVRLLAALSADESVAVRKASVGSLSLLTKTVPLRKARAAWVGNVLPLVLDVEVTVSEKALEEVEAGILEPLMTFCEGKMADMKNEPVILLLKEFDSEATEYLQRSLKALVKKNEGKLPTRLLKAFKKTAEACLRPLEFEDWPLGVWSLVEEATALDEQAINPDLVLDAWGLVCEDLKKVDSKDALGEDSGNTTAVEAVGVKLLCILEQVAKKVPQSRAMAFAAGLRSAIVSFTAPTALIRGMMRVLEHLGTAGLGGACLEQLLQKKEGQESSEEHLSWKVSVLRSIQATIYDFVGYSQLSMKNVNEPPSVPKVCRVLLTLGELALMDQMPIGDGVLTATQTLATNTLWTDGKHIETHDAIRGHAFVALGKMCLRREQLAKKSVELFVLHLDSKESFVVRNNVLIVLADLSVHYTSLVDRFVPLLSDLLRDPNELLRKQAAMVLSSLLSEDFVKFRGSIMLRFFYMLSDPSDMVRYFVECVFVRILHQRNQGIFMQNFLEVVCAINGFSALSSYQGALGNEDFSLARSPKRRAMIYRFMLGLMDNAHKYHIFSQLVTNILQAFVDSEEKLELPATENEPAGQVLNDALSLLGCKEMRICFSTKQEGVEGAQEGQNNEADAARGILSNLLKRNLCENIVPVLIQLKDLMERKFSPFLRQLRHCLREILRDFKDDLKDILAGDAQLASEIAFDLEKEQDAPQGESPKKKMPKNPLATRRESLGKMMAPDAVTPGGTPPNTPAIQDTENRRRSSMGLPKARRSTGSPGTPGSVRGAAALDSVSLPVVQSQDDPSQPTADSPRQTRTQGSVRCTGASPAPSSAVRQRQAAIARAAQADSANADVPPQSIDFGVADALSTTTRMTAPDPNNLEPIAEDEPMAEVEALCAKAAGTPTQKGGKIIVGKENEGQKKKRGRPAKTSVAQ